MRMQSCMMMMSLSLIALASALVPASAFLAVSLNTGGTVPVRRGAFEGGMRPLSRSGIIAPALRHSPSLRMATGQRPDPESPQGEAQTGAGEVWIRGLDLDPEDQPVDAVALSSDAFVPMEGDIVEYVSDGAGSDAQVHTGMVVSDGVDGEVFVKKLLRREGDGEYDEWQCFVCRNEKVENVGLENVRYIGTCNECVEVTEAIDSLFLDNAISELSKE